jgi:transposase
MDAGKRKWIDKNRRSAAENRRSAAENRRLADESQRLATENRRLAGENRRLLTAVDDLERNVHALRGQVQSLTAALEEAQRAGKRQAAPFRKDKTVQQPKKPGRKPGKKYGTHVRRAPPPDASSDEQHEAPLPADCPKCGSHHLHEDEPTTEQFQTEIVTYTVRRKFTIHRGHCRECGAAVCGRHALQTSEAIGAAGEQLGPNVHAWISLLNKRLGLSHGKIGWLFDKLFGLKIARATSARSVVRTSRRLDAAYRQIRDDVRAADEVTPDETGWRVGGGKAWLHVFAAEKSVCYEIDPTRSGDVAERLLGIDWNKRLVHDGWRPYDRFLQAIHQQCNAHLLNRCKGLLEVARGGAARFPLTVKQLLQSGLAARDRYRDGEISLHGLRTITGRLTSQLASAVGGRFAHDGNRRLANFLGDHLNEVFAYLHHQDVNMAATNYRGEQAVRLGVINRKVWGGNRTWLGAWAQSVVMSVNGTCHLRGIDVLDFLVTALTSTTPRLLAEPP